MNNLNSWITGNTGLIQRLQIIKPINTTPSKVSTVIIASCSRSRCKHLVSRQDYLPELCAESEQSTGSDTACLLFAELKYV